MKAQCQARQISGEVFIETKLICYRWLELAACGAFSESNFMCAKPDRCGTGTDCNS